jgi:hypothetical protein
MKCNEINFRTINLHMASFRESPVAVAVRHQTLNTAPQEENFAHWIVLCIGYLSA